MLVRVKIDQAQTLRDLEVETYRDTFGPYIVEKDLEDYFSTVLSLEQIEKDLQDPESETYLSSMKNKKYVVFSRSTGAKHRPSQ